MRVTTITLLMCLPIPALAGTPSDAVVAPHDSPVDHGLSDHFRGPPFAGGRLADWNQSVDLGSPSIAQAAAPLVFGDGAADSAGGLIIAWDDFRSLDADVYAQRLDGQGQKLWDSHGVPICTASGSQGRLVVVPDGSGGALIGWVDRRNERREIYAQRVSDTGAVHWTQDGVRLGPGEPSSSNVPAMVADGEGGAIVTWEHNKRILVQRVSAEGTVLWTESLEISPEPGELRQPAIVSDGSGGAIAAWSHETGDFRSIRAQRLGPDGDLLWGSSGVVIHGDTGLPQTPSISPDGEGGAIVGYHIQLVDQTHIFAQRLSSDGTLMWGTVGTPVIEAPGGRSGILVADGKDDILAVWSESRDGSEDHYLYAQRLNADGTRQWEDDGVRVISTPRRMFILNVVLKDEGNAIISWGTPRKLSSEIYAQKINSEGIPQWEGGVGVATRSDARRPNMVTDGEDGVIMFWDDFRSLDADVYAQRLDGSGCPQWAANGVGVHIDSGKQRFPDVSEDEEGGAFVVWQEKEGDNYDLYVRRLNASGAEEWPRVAASKAPGGQIGPHSVPDGSGDVIVAWWDNRNGNWDVFAQRIRGGNGDVLWGQDGIPVCTDPALQWGPLLAPDGMGGAIVAWEDWRQGSLVYAQRIDSLGESQWAMNGIPIAWEDTAFQVDPSMAADGFGGALIAWGRWGIGSGTSIRVQRLSAAGELLWGPQGIEVCFEARFSGFARIALVGDGSGGAIVTWVGGDELRLYGQRVDADGIPRWSLCGVQLSNTPARRPNMIPDNEGGAIVTWLDRVSGRVLVQRLDADGNLLWNEGVVLNSQVSFFSPPDIVPDLEGGAIVAWVDGRNGDHDIYAQRVLRDGVRQWQDGGVPVINVPGSQRFPAAAGDGAGGMIVTWQDHRSGDRDFVYTNRLDASGNVAPGWPQDGVTPVSILVTKVSVESGCVFLTWYVGERRPLSATVYRSVGHDEWSEIAALSPQDSYLSFKDCDVLVGEKYGYRLHLRLADEEIRSEEVWVDVPELVNGLVLRGLRPNPSPTDEWFLSFSTSLSAPVVVELYNPAGRLVLSHSLGMVIAGDHLIRVSTEASLASGVYFLRLEQGGHAASARVVLLR